MNKNLLDLSSLTKDEIKDILDLSADIKKDPETYSQKLKGKTLMMLFAKPSLRTRVSFETGMTRLGGHAIFYDISTSPMGKKESIADTAKASTRYVDIVMARLFEHKDIVEFAENSNVPVINGLTNYSHPCQILADLMTIREKKSRLKGLKLCYLGDSNNNVTHSLIFGCAIAGIDISIGCPEKDDYMPLKQVIDKGKQLATVSGSTITVTHDPKEAIKDSDVVYTDSWMSYHIPEQEKAARIKLFQPYQVNKELMSHAKPDAIFMNCLPAMRGMEQTAEVIDGPQSVVFDQAENRMYAQQAVMLGLLGVK
jgi:ornithine carbamoyltransferase